MQTAPIAPPPETLVEHDPVSRLVNSLIAEGYTPLHQEEEAAMTGERVYHRREKVSFVQGETIFVLIDFPVLTEKVLSQAIEGQTQLFRARRKADRALSVFQPLTIFVCIIARNESPHTASLNRYIQNTGGAIVIPVIVVPEINQVVYPTVDDRGIGPIPARIQFLQYILGERRDNVNLHRSTIRTFYVSAALVGVLALAAVVSWVASFF